jgi:hypothetical protein
MQSIHHYFGRYLRTKDPFMAKHSQICGNLSNFTDSFTLFHVVDLLHPIINNSAMA